MVWTATVPRGVRVNKRLQLAFEGFIENGGEHRVKLVGGLGLDGFEGGNLAL